VSVEAPGDIAIELDGKRVASGNGSVKASELAMERGQHVVKIIATIKAAGASAIDFYDERGPAAVEAADAFYGISAGDHGFEVIYHEQQDFAARVVATGRMPFAVPTDPLPTSQAIEYRGVLNASSPGEYGFALDGANSVQLFVDDELVVDNGGSHASRRIEGAVELTPGPHLVSIQYLATTRPDWAVFFKTPDGDWKRADGSEFDPPTTAYVPAALAALKPDDSWGGARKFDKLEAPQAVTVLRDGTLVVGSRDTLGFIGQDGQVLRTLKLDSAVDVTDLASGPNGEIIAGDRASKTLLVLNGDGDLIRTINGPFDSIAGIDAGGDSVVVVSPAGGMVYSVPLAGGAPTLLPMSAADAPVRAAQPSDVVSAPDGTMYAADFEKHKIVIVPPGRPARVVNGVTGVGAQVPHMAIYKKLLLVTDPTGSRVVIYDSSGKQRGVFVFPAKAEGTRPVGIAITPDGYVYIADATGFVYRLGISAPPELTN
jgi:hypothetical protein